MPSIFTVLVYTKGFVIEHFWPEATQVVSLSLSFLQATSMHGLIALNSRVKT